VLLSAEAIAAEQRWLERFHAARSADDGDEAKDRAEFTLSERHAIVACSGCGTVLREPRPAPAEVAETYAADHYGDAVLERLARNQDAFFLDKLRQLRTSFARLGAGARVLEIGSFVGGFLHSARRAGWDATGIDLGYETTRFARRRGFTVRQGDLLELDLPRGAHDAVFIWSTFDQLSRPSAVLDRVRALLRPDGMLVLRVPNGRFETACVEIRRAARGSRRTYSVLCAQAYNNFVSFPYLTGYTPESLCGLLEAHAFTCESVHGDTILPLADEETLSFAVREERRVKRAVRRICHATEQTMHLLFHPWLDVVAHRDEARCGR
jgi:2-polyprenyl-3-methyl-5-hydroxy-6-metoxy-1,4-benzoquinol methylase